MPEEVQLVDFKLKCKLEYKGHHMTMKVHHQEVLNALEWLMKHNSLYAGISQNSQWERDCEASTLWQYIIGQRTSDEQEDIVNSNNYDSRSADVEVPEIVDNNYDNETSEDQAAIDRNVEITTQPFPSCLQLDDIQGATFCVAPGEGQVPKYIITDDNFEVLSFPDLFPTGEGGFHTILQWPRKLDMRRYYNQRLLNCDGRFSSCVEYLLAAQYATELKQIQGNIGIALHLQRGTSTHGRRLTAGMLQNPQTVQHLIYKEQAYKFLNSVHGTIHIGRKCCMKL